jgi:hypothetical protein
MSFILGQKRSDTSMSGDSVEKMLVGQDIEMDVTNTKTSPSIDQSMERKSSGSMRGTPTPMRAPTPIIAPSSTNNPTTAATKDSSSKSFAKSPARPMPAMSFSNSSPDYAYKASAGADRWESLMKQQQIKNKAKEKGKRNSGEKSKDKKKARYGEVAYGGGVVAHTDNEGESEGRLNGGMGLGLGGIAVTKTVVSTSVSDDAR